MRPFVILFASLAVTPVWAVNQYHQHPNQTPQLNQALKVGTDTDGKSLYLCIARLFNSTQPGKTWAGYGSCNVPYGGKEYIANDYFHIPSAREFRNVYWQRNIQRGVVVGHEANGRPLYLCQAMFRGSLQPGKTWMGYNHCNISYAGAEIIMDNYRVLNQDGDARIEQGPRAQVYHR